MANSRDIWDECALHEHVADGLFLTTNRPLCAYLSIMMTLILLLEQMVISGYTLTRAAVDGAGGENSWRRKWGWLMLIKYTQERSATTHIIIISIRRIVLVQCGVCGKCDRKVLIKADCYSEVWLAELRGPNGGWHVCQKVVHTIKSQALCYRIYIDTK